MQNNMNPANYVKINFILVNWKTAVNWKDYYQQELEHTILIEKYNFKKIVYNILKQNTYKYSFKRFILYVCSFS